MGPTAHRSRWLVSLPLPRSHSFDAAPLARADVDRAAVDHAAASAVMELLEDRRLLSGGTPDPAFGNGGGVLDSAVAHGNAAAIAPSGIGLPNRPFALSANATSPTSVTVMFYDNSSGNPVEEDAFVVERSTSAAGPFAVVATLPTQPGVGFRTVTDATAAAGTTYFYRVKAVNGPYQTAYEGPTSVTTPGVSVPPNDGGLPNRPFALTAAAVSATDVRLQFYDNSTYEAANVIERATSAGGPYTVIATLPGTTTTGLVTYADATAAANTT